MVFLGAHTASMCTVTSSPLFDCQPNCLGAGAGWLGSFGGGALQATLGASTSLAPAYLRYKLFEKRVLRLKRPFETAKESAPQRPAAVVGAGP